MTKILVTGANSFIGNNFIKFSENKDISTISLRDKDPSVIDLTSFDIILHLAAIVHIMRDLEEEEYFRVNKKLTLDLANNAKRAGVKQFIFMSTIKVYGDFKNDSKPWTEDSPCFPSDPYARSKYEAELELRKLEDAGFTVSIIRTSVVYGDGVKGNILRLMKLVRSFTVLPFAEVHNNRSYIFTRNLVAFIDRIIELRASGIFLTKDDGHISTTDLVSGISAYLGRKIILFKLPGWVLKGIKSVKPGLIDRLYGSVMIDNTSTKLKLDFKPPFTTGEGLRIMITNYKKAKLS